jgi:hypothetical protein
MIGALALCHLFLAMTASADVSEGAPSSAATVPAPAPTARQERLAVLILPDKGTPSMLADNLTEVVLSRVVERTNVQVVGTAEFRKRLGMNGDDRAGACIDDLACLGRAGVALGVRRVVTGTVREEQSQYYINFVLTDIQTGRIEGRFFRLVQGRIEGLIAATQEGTDDLFRKRPDPGRLRIDSMPAGARVNVDGVYVGTTPMVSGPLLPGVHEVRVEREGHFPWTTGAQVVAATDLEIKLLPEQLPARRRWPTVAMTTAIAGAVISLGTGAALGTFSQLAPSGATRAELQDDLDRRHGYAQSANIAFGLGATFVLAASVIYAVYRHDVVGE